MSVPTMTSLPTTPVPMDEAADHAARLLAALGLDLTGPELAATPGRMVRALKEMTTPPTFTATDFETTAEPGQLVLVRDIRFVSVCEHHVLPFTGVAHIGYVPRKRILGLSKVARVVHHCARRLQVQERLTGQIADWMVEHLDPAGVAVLLSAEHTCMTLRGVGATGSRTTTSSLRGVLLDDPAARAEFMSLAVSAP
ncbi:GTP cyclohydrolase I [Streptacidiphilus carbonis]|uniref:GTP cyclohydrolase I n=1 Tax=Streptacidiphilus carbonis TaxID=105422 RepID=UPI0006933611|nr:GTP cyclohydrolase I [Streptacidiphilus carbonis]